MTEKSPCTREQIRAAKAYGLISRVPENEAKNFGRQCLRLPALIHQCGLCQAIAFLQSKNREVIELLAQVMSAPDQTSRQLDGTQLAQQAREADMMEYQRLTREALKASQWLKRYSEVILKVKPGDTPDDRYTAGEK